MFGSVRCSRAIRRVIASSFVWPHISKEGRNETQTAGRSGSPKTRQRPSLVSWTQRTPAGLPSGMPGMGEEIDGAMQQAAQCARQSIGSIPSSQNQP